MRRPPSASDAVARVSHAWRPLLASSAVRVDACYHSAWIWVFAVTHLLLMQLLWSTHLSLWRDHPHGSLGLAGTCIRYLAPSRFLMRSIQPTTPQNTTTIIDLTCPSTTTIVPFLGNDNYVDEYIDGNNALHKNKNKIAAPKVINSSNTIIIVIIQNIRYYKCHMYLYLHCRWKLGQFL